MVYHSSRTLFQVSTKVVDLSAHSRDKDMGNFLLRPVVARHYDDELRFVRRGRSAKDGRSDEMAVREV